MTTKKESTPHAERQGPQRLPPEPDRREELDAEIVRDLEVDERAADVRGGICASSHAGVNCVAS
jgi:hypothetical protein